MRFNLLVGAVWRLVAFGMGAGFAAMGLLVMCYLLPGVWLPIGLAIVVSVLMSTETWLTKHRLSGPVSAALGFGVCAGWLASSGFTAKAIDVAYLPATALAGVSFIAFLLVLTRTVAIPKKQRRPAWWAVSLIVMAWLVSVGSSAEGGADVMKSWLMHGFGLTSTRADEVIPVIRKSIHFSFYGLTALFARKMSVTGGAKVYEAWRFALLLTLAVASFDEIRQSMVPNRTSSIVDVMIDMSGAVVLLLIAQWHASYKPSGRKLST